MIAVALMLAASHSCTTLLRTPSRFRGTVRSVEILEEKRTRGNVADSDPRFAVVIEVVSVEPGLTEPRVGQRLTFSIHSPTRTFAVSNPRGRSFDLQAERMDCDGEFDEFITLERRLSTPIIENLAGGFLEVGHPYRIKPKWNGKELQYNLDFELPMHHDGEFSFTNSDEFLTHPEQVHEIVFEVTSLRITMTGEMSWLSSFEAKILSAR